MDDSNLCLDTDVIIFFLKGREPTATLVEKVVRSYSCHVASVTAYELLFGVARANQEIGEHALLGMMKVLHLI
ncbi:MAG: PIN domain-containing protein [Anaerolineae bacterium]|nr:PIN domain-containing protein [Anaerolineae bacterium]